MQAEYEWIFFVQYVPLLPSSRTHVSYYLRVLIYTFPNKHQSDPVSSCHFKHVPIPISVLFLY